MGGKFHRVLEEQHKIHGELRYLWSHLRRLESLGKAVRVSPNEVSFSSARSLKDIYGAVPGTPTFTKSEFYNVVSAGFESTSIGSERDPQVHSRMKRSLLSAFSAKSLREQEGIVQGCIDSFLVAIGGKGQMEGGIDMTKWFEILAFDITGEMSFGESFGCIEQGMLPRLVSESEGILLISWIVLRGASPMATNGREAFIRNHSHRQPSEIPSCGQLGQVAGSKARARRSKQSYGFQQKPSCKVGW